MRKISITQVPLEKRESWDRYVDQSINGTIFHKISFLEYHGERFHDSQRFLEIYSDKSLIAQISCDLEVRENRIGLFSPYGGSYGGFVFSNAFGLETYIGLLHEFLEYAKSESITNLELLQPIACCSQMHLDSFTFALLQTGFSTKSRDISSVIRLADNYYDKKVFSKIVMRNLKTAKKHNITIRDNAPLDDFWHVLTRNFIKHSAEPTHSYDQFNSLISRFHKEMKYTVAYDRETPVAGIFSIDVNSLVRCTFYLCQDPEYQELRALTLLIVHEVERARNDGFSFLDLGTSSVNSNPYMGVLSFKEHFTKETFFREKFEMVL